MNCPPRRFALAFSAVLVLAGCASREPPHPQPDLAAVAKYRSQGYPGAAIAGIETRALQSPIAEVAPWTATLTRPADHAPRPVVVFLPPLGERDDAGSAWVQVWAHAGYAVLALQPLADDADAWTSPAARNGDFDRVARDRFAADLMPGRVQRLAAVLEALRRRSQGGDPALDGLDWSRTAIAGVDLGAAVVQALAEAPAPILSFTPAAYVAVSPFAPRDEAPPRPAGDPAAALLMITSTEDTDAYGVVTDPGIRRHAFDRIAAADAWFLELLAVPHRWLEGYVHIATPAEAAPRRMPPQQQEGPDRRGRRGGGSGNSAAREAMAPDMEDEQDPAAVARDRAARLEADKARARVLTRLGLERESFEAVSVAFLDATLRRDPAARGWLVDSAPKWLQEGDRLKHR